ncbi:MAG TPA: ribose-phosphate pyrophosphokinase-like domain-containing protein [Candidatus Binatia bacterium]|nr:ribose-phosphate pyrophosphokinase-like domain-containing protein [Candidatus Binatia bacterium]
MAFAPIKRDPDKDFRVTPNLLDYGRTCAEFSWEKIERDFTESPSECGLNIAYERVDPEILSGSANPVLAEKIAKLLGVKLAPRILERCPDGELHIEIQQSVHGFLAR